MPINLTITKTPEKSKKRFRAIFRIHKGGDIIKITDFGLKNPKKGTYIDQTNGGNIKDRENYRARHKGDLKTKDYKRAGFLSYFLLWGDSTSLQKNLKQYKKKYKLN